MQGKQPEDSPGPVNADGFVIHGTVHALRHDAPCQLPSCDEQVKAGPGPADWEKCARNRSLFSG